MTSSPRTTQEPQKSLFLKSKYGNIKSKTLVDNLSYPFYGERSEGDEELVIARPHVEGPVHVEYGCTINLSGLTTMFGNCIVIYTPFSDVKFGEHSWIYPGLTIIAAERSESLKNKNGKPLIVGRKVTIGDCCWIGEDVVLL